MSKCAPSRISNGWTCFETEELIGMVNAWNASRLGSPIKLDHDKKTLWKNLAKSFEPMCGNDESCWIENKQFMMSLKSFSPELYESVNNYSLKPKFLKGKRAWLSTLDIEYVMHQYEDIYPDFVFIGCYPSDHFKLHSEDIPIDAFREYNCSAIVFNQDETHKSGSHWVAVFFTHPSGILQSIEYFDPTGDPPVPHIKLFLNHPIFNGISYIQSTFPHQRGNNECGVYSMYYILQRLKGRSLQDINKKRITDTEMNEYRKHLFRME